MWVQGYHKESSSLSPADTFVVMDLRLESVCWPYFGIQTDDAFFSVPATHHCLRVRGTFQARDSGDCKVARTQRLESLRYANKPEVRYGPRMRKKPLVPSIGTVADVSLVVSTSTQAASSKLAFF